MRRPPVISMAEFKSWAACCGISAAGQAVSAAKLMNDLGVIVYVHEGKDGLDDLVILDPQWLMRLMATLITTKPNFVKNGVLLASDLPQIWKPPDFPEILHASLMSLLEKFEISYPLPKKGEYLLPYLIHSQRPSALDYSFKEPCVYRSYRFGFLPFGFFSRLVVRLMHFLEAVSYWQNGILLKHQRSNVSNDVAYCLMECFVDNSLSLNIQVSGPAYAKCIRLIIESVDLLISQWYKIYYEVFIPCICARYITLLYYHQNFIINC
jgi:internalin A